MTNNQYRSQPELKKMTLSFVIATLLIEELNVYVMTDKLSFKLRSTSSTTHNLSCSHHKTARQINEEPTQNGIHYHFGGIPTMLPRLSLSYIWGVFLQNFNVSVLRAY